MKKLTATQLYALIFGAFLGLCVWKFGNPVILDHKIQAPETPVEFWNYPWPIHWANRLLLVLALIGAGVFIRQPKKNVVFPSGFILWLPLIWLGWQFISAVRTVDSDLTVATLWQFCGCVACYYLGMFVIGNNGADAGCEGKSGKAPHCGLPVSGLTLLYAGILAAFVFCQIRGVNQRLFEFPASYQMLSEGESCEWTNFPPATVAGMKLDNLIIHTNGVDVANPVILEKFRKGRIAGTLVYPNALAGLILLLFPVSLVLTVAWTKRIRPFIRYAAIGLMVFLGLATFYWTGSKLGWLVGIGLAGLFLLQLKWPNKLKIIAIAFVLVLGLGVFAVRFHHYFSAGATSVGARFDYWRAAVQTTVTRPIFGSGPGTFQRPYGELKAPESEMARLTHNDYLEQFSDSGLIGGMSYLAWIVLSLWLISKQTRVSGDWQQFAIFAGLLAWFIQGFGEFGLYIPALAWVAFTLLGSILSRKAIEFDKKPQSS